MRSRLMVRFHLRQLNCRGFPLSVLNLSEVKCLIYDHTFAIIIIQTNSLMDHHYLLSARTWNVLRPEPY